MTKEGNIQASGRMTASEEGANTFRNNVGGAWSGKKVSDYTKGGKRYAVIENPRWITFGLMHGSGDTVGWKSVTITAEMIGRKIAQFLSIEFKTENGRPGKGQVEWHDAVHKAGGLSGFARCDDDVRRIIAGEKVDP